jgi:hypothetical protein
MKRLILKLCVLCALTAVYASGIDKIPADDPPGGGGSPSTCTGLDGVTCVCPAPLRCYKSLESCLCAP